MDLDALRSAGVDVTTTPVHLNAYRRDLWPRDTLAMLTSGERPPAPLAVATPTHADHVATAIAWALEHGVTVVPYGAGSGVCGGGRGREGSLVVDMKRLNRIREIDVNARTARIDAGILGQHLEDQLSSMGWMTAHSPSSIACSTAGGYLAARSAGPFSSRYGVFDDMTLAAKAECPTGRLLCGTWTPDGQEDWLPVLTGSEGGLGVVTELLVRIQPLPQTRWFRGFAFPTVEAAWRAMQDIMQANLWPSVLRLYDPVDTKIGGKTKASDAKAGGGMFGWLKSVASSNPALKRHLMSIPLAMPGLLNRIGRGMSDEVLLIVGFEGPIPLVNASVEAAVPLLQEGRDLGAAPGQQWFDHRHDVSYKLAPVFMAGAFADTMEVAARWDRLPDLYAQVQGALGRHTAVMAHFSHAYQEGCSIYFSFAGRGSLKTYDATWRAALDAARAAGGTVTHHHGVGILKADAAAKEAGHALRIWDEAKTTWDPTNLMNPGRPFPVETSDTEEPEWPAPRGGPVFELNIAAGTARVDPGATPGDIQAALAKDGHSLRYVPDRPLGTWLGELKRGVLDCWQTPLFAIQARFPDGKATRIFPAPRSAAGPDLRWGLLRRASAEWVEVPVRPVEGDLVVEANHPHLDARELRPLWTTKENWGFSSHQAPLATHCLLPDGDGEEPIIRPEHNS